MTYREIDPQTLEAWAIVFTAMGGGIMGIYHLFYRYVRKRINHDNHESLIEVRVSKLEQGLIEFKKWAEEKHDEMNQETRDKIDEIKEDLSEVKNAISENTGYLKALLNKTP